MPTFPPRVILPLSMAYLSSAVFTEPPSILTAVSSFTLYALPPVLSTEPPVWVIAAPAPVTLTASPDVDRDVLSPEISTVEVPPPTLTPPILTPPPFVLERVPPVILTFALSAALMILSPAADILPPETVTSELSPTFIPPLFVLVMSALPDTVTFPVLPVITA